MYDTTLGRFLERDPFGIAAGDRNLYRYVQDRPTKAADPSGLRTRELPVNVEKGHIEGVVTLSIQTQRESSYWWWPLDWWSDVGAPQKVETANPKNANEARGKTILTSCFKFTPVLMEVDFGAPGPTILLTKTVAGNPLFLGIAGAVITFPLVDPHAPQPPRQIQLIPLKDHYIGVNETNSADLAKLLQSSLERARSGGFKNWEDTICKSMKCYLNMLKKLGFPDGGVKPPPEKR